MKNLELVPKKSYLDRSWSESLKFSKTSSMIDLPLFFCLFALLLIGLLTCFSSYYAFSAQRSANLSIYYFINRQLTWALIGLILATFCTFIKIEFLYKVTPALWVFTVIANILPALEIFGSTRGGSRWIELGAFSFQPSELAKLTLALYLSRVLHRKEEELDSNWLSAVKPAIMTLLMCTPIYFQNDFSTTSFIFGMSIIIFFISGIAMRYIIAEVVLIISMGLPTIFLIGYRSNRISAWLNPGLDPNGIGWQPRIARMAIESGGFWGKGIGEGTYKLGSMSLVSSDYIFTVLAEEFGFLGMATVLLLFCGLVYRGWKISNRQERSYETILTFSLVLLIAGQAFLNIAVVCGLLPVTGVPLPFFSAGGSSLLVTIIMSGILLNLSRGVKL